MNTIFVNSEKNKASDPDPYRLFLNLTDKIDLYCFIKS